MTPADQPSGLTAPALRRFKPYALHPRATFEGFYTKFALPSGAAFIFILCSVPGAHAHNLTLTYVPPPSSSEPIWQRELAPAAVTAASTPTSFTLTAVHDGAELARLHATPASAAYAATLPDGTRFAARTHAPPPWSATSPGPEGSLLLALPLPLHWHVRTLAAPADVSLALPGVALPDRAGAALAHEEKNWAAGFPAAHVWLAARDPAGGGASVCLAGGRTLGLDAALVGVRLPAHGVALDFRPPWALALPGWAAPFFRLDADWSARRLGVRVRGVRWRVDVEAVGPRDERAWFGFAAPQAGGFEPGGMAETLGAAASVRVFRRTSWLWALVPFAGARGWELVATHAFENAALEFGGAYYPQSRAGRAKQGGGGG